jgi:DNA repair protein RecO (recombination protein O)
LRTYELLLLREIGFLPQLDVQTMTLRALEPDARYVLVPEGGLRQAHSDDRVSLAGRQWTQLQASLEDSAPFTTTLRACAEMMGELKPQLRALLHYHCGVKTLRSRQMMIDIQSL